MFNFLHNFLLSGFYLAGAFTVLLNLVMLALNLAVLLK
jgi:hypothetical protein